MRLRDLHPTLEGMPDKGVLSFDCPIGKSAPKAGLRRKHRVQIPVGATNGDQRWTISGAFPDSTTVMPSINEVDEHGATACWHGFVENGEVRNA